MNQQLPSLLALPWLPEPPQDFSARCKAVGSSAATAGYDLQFLAGHRLTARELSLLGRAIKRNMSGDLAPLSRFRLGILAGATVDLLLDSLPGSAARHGVGLELVTTPYGQVMQEALAGTSSISKAELDAALVLVDHRWLNLDAPHLAGDPSARVDAAMERLRAIIEGLRTNSNTPAILTTLPQPPFTLFGSYDRRVRGSVRALLDRANDSIIRLAEETGSYLLDVAALAEQIGTERWFDPVQWAAYKLPFSSECFPIFADTLGRLLGAIRGKARKCLVLDLDNTVWGGVIGDDGLTGIEIGQGSSRGESFLAVQQLALDLRERGVMIAVCSKNDDATARLPFREHPDMLLRENHITVFQANWTDKASNIEAIARTLNIGLDALVLLDDNPAERAQVRAALPAVAVPELPNDVSWYPWFLSSAGYFEAVGFSDEDRLRLQSYASDAQRADVMAKARNVGDYLASLEMTIKFNPFDEQGKTRISQLINKTNQFNLTTRRYTEAEVTAMMADKTLFTLQVRLADKFSDLGMIGVVICRPRDSMAWDIDTWLMSCRVLGRRVEEAMLACVMEGARQRGIARLFGAYIPTSKNGMVADHYAKLGFRHAGEIDQQTLWEINTADYVAPTLPMRVERGAGQLPQAAE